MAPWSVTSAGHPAGKVCRCVLRDLPGCGGGRARRSRAVGPTRQETTGIKVGRCRHLALCPAAAWGKTVTPETGVWPFDSVSERVLSCSDRVPHMVTSPWAVLELTLGLALPEEHPYSCWKTLGESFKVFQTLLAMSLLSL